VHVCIYINSTCIGQVLREGSEWTLIVTVRECDQNSANVNEGTKNEVVQLLQSAACSKYERK